VEGRNRGRASQRGSGGAASVGEGGGEKGCPLDREKSALYRRDAALDAFLKQTFTNASDAFQATVFITTLLRLQNKLTILLAKA